MINIVISALGGGITAAYFSHLLAFRRESKRDSEQRKREFRGYLAEFDSRIVRLSGDVGQADIHKLWTDYINEIHAFHRESAKVAGDFPRRKEFRELCAAFGDVGYKTVTQDPEGTEPRNLLREKLRAIIDFTAAPEEPPDPPAI